METNHPPPAAAAAAPESRIEAELQRIRALMERGQLAPALEQAQALRAEVPENRDVLYVVAVCQRYLNQIPLALGTLAELERLHPNYSRLFQERGHCYTAQRAAQPAIEAFLRAVNLNPALPASWKSLQALYRITGQAQQAATAASHVDTLARLPMEVVTASSMLADGELQPAERIIRPFLLQHGDHVEGMRVLAKIGMKVGVLDDAETLLERLLELAPDYQAARYDYVRVLLDRHRDAKAVSEL
jgi:tetratricopeptide (TPR) repeat protein